MLTQQKSGVSIERIWCCDGGKITGMMVQFNSVETHVEANFGWYFGTLDLLQGILTVGTEGKSRFGLLQQLEGGSS